MAADTLIQRPTLARRAPATAKTAPSKASKTHGKTATKPAAPKVVAAKPVPNEASETLQRTRESVSHVSGEYVAICTDTLSAAMETGTLTSKLLTEMNQSYIEACTGSLSAFAEISRESLTCRSPADLLALQQKAAEAITASMNSTGRFYGGLFTAFSQVMDPLVTRASHAPERLFKALAD